MGDSAMGEGDSAMGTVEVVGDLTMGSKVTMVITVYVSVNFLFVGSTPLYYHCKNPMVNMGMCTLCSGEPWSIWVCALCVQVNHGQYAYVHFTLAKLVCKIYTLNANGGREGNT